MAMQETELEFVLGFATERAVALLEQSGWLSDTGVSRLDEIRRQVDQSRLAWDHDSTGPSYVHRLARDLITQGLINETGLTVHAIGPRPFTVWIAKYGLEDESGSAG
jgi:hypothetical protein